MQGCSLQAELGFWLERLLPKTNFLPGLLQRLPVLQGLGGAAMVLTGKPSTIQGVPSLKWVYIHFWACGETKTGLMLILSACRPAIRSISSLETVNQLC